MLIVYVFQNSMNLPPDKVRLLRSYDNEKKWELICDQVSCDKKVNEFDPEEPTNLKRQRI